MYSIRTHRLVVIIQTSLIIPFVIFDLISLFQRSIYHMAIAYGFSAAYLILAIFILVRTILFSPRINTNLIFGALVAYFLAGVLWAKFYLIENLIYPGSFRNLYGLVDFNNTHFSELYNLQFHLIYYSFSTLTTLGMGDIVPLHPQAKALTIIEAMFGQLFLAIIIAKLVSIWGQMSKQQKSEMTIEQ